MLRFAPRKGSLPEDAKVSLAPFSGITAQLLTARGITTAEQAHTFMHPELSMLHDPHLLNDMDKALSIFQKAKAENWSTVVYGDYDVDGICACSLLTSALRAYGMTVTPHLPLRSEGYGLNCDAVRSLAKTHRLLVTVDLGITNHEEVLLAKSLGMTVIVTDHHGLALTPSPADAVINPLLADYPYARLCGAGVAFKVAQALLGIERCHEYLDLAALATVCDMVPLLDENRILVSYGIPCIASKQRVGLSALLTVSSNPETIDTDVLGFRLGPRLNAAGRLGDANLAVQLLLTDDMGEADTIAKTLERLNQERKDMENAMVEEAFHQAEKNDFLKNPALIIKGEDWHAGVIGLVASRLCQRYFCPTCVLSESHGVLHGSLRSVSGVHIHHCLQKLDDLLDRYGGHELAAGVTFATDHFDAFFDRLQAEVRKADPACFVPVRHYDADVTLADCNRTLFDELSLMKPFGMENPAPQLLVQKAHLEERRAVGATGAHLKLTLRKGDAVMGGIAFSMGKMATSLPNEVDVLFHLSENTFRGQTTLQAQVQALRPVHEAQMTALSTPDEVSEQRALMDAIQALPTSADAFLCQTNATWAMLSESLSSNDRGILIVARTKQSAQHAFALSDLSLCYHSTEDARCFHSLLLFPDIQAVQGKWQEIWLVDGLISPAEAMQWHTQCPDATLRIFPTSSTLCQMADALDAKDPAYRQLYRAMRANLYGSLHALSNAVSLTPLQTEVGLLAFDALSLIDYQPSPFSYRICPPTACQLVDSPILSGLRALSSAKEVMP